MLRVGQVNKSSTDAPKFIPLVPNSAPMVLSNNFGNADKKDPKTNGFIDKPKKADDNPKMDNRNQPPHNVRNNKLPCSNALIISHALVTKLRGQKVMKVSVIDISPPKITTK
ncbi:hypothetical protein FXO38_00458 [Capsicum annuum]|nr:hypothetical protein FXO38_00458 [Capsicum annuum]